MSILHDGVFSSTTRNGLGMFEFNSLNIKQVTFLKAITKRQRSKFKKFGIIPLNLLHVLWDFGFIPVKVEPKSGMRIPVLLELLFKGPFKDLDQQQVCSWLYERIVQEELVPKKTKRGGKNNGGSDFFIKHGRREFIPLSHIRSNPGTMF